MWSAPSRSHSSTVAVRSCLSKRKGKKERKLGWRARRGHRFGGAYCLMLVAKGGIQRDRIDPFFTPPWAVPVDEGIMPSFWIPPPATLTVPGGGTHTGLVQRTEPPPAASRPSVLHHGVAASASRTARLDHFPTCPLFESRRTTKADKPEYTVQCMAHGMAILIQDQHQTLYPDWTSIARSSSSGSGSGSVTHSCSSNCSNGWQAFVVDGLYTYLQKL
ncbi:hypothetical protein Taro_012350 [Colocasia esculenta]|uniref:Uncharacterized protein n=1 Tax=Colocasia esculenta TaxID=4460 RepID=A0A843UIX2_COLES|nr:hypothetical protein [Colocasia esculenta]